MLGCLSPDDESGVSSVCHAVYFLRLVLNTDLPHNALQEFRFEAEGSADMHDLRSHLVTLGMQMVAQGVDVVSDDVQQLKYCLAAFAGFAHSTLEEVLVGTRKKLLARLGLLQMDYHNDRQRMAILTVVRGLRKVLDSTQLVKVVNGVEVNEIGKEFVDMVLIMFSSDVELKRIGHLALRSWLDLLQIVIFKVPKKVTCAAHRRRTGELTGCKPPSGSLTSRSSRTDWSRRSRDS